MSAKLKQRAVINGKVFWLTGSTQQELFQSYLSHAITDKKSAEIPKFRHFDMNKTILWGTVKYYAQIRLQVWQNKVCTRQGTCP